MHTHPCDEHAIIIFNKEFCSKGNSKSRGMLEADRQGISWKTHYNLFYRLWRRDYSYHCEIHIHIIIVEECIMYTPYGKLV